MEEEGPKSNEEARRERNNGTLEEVVMINVRARQRRKSQREKVKLEESETRVNEGGRYGGKVKREERQRAMKGVTAKEEKEQGSSKVRRGAGVVVRSELRGCTIFYFLFYITSDNSSANTTF